VRRVRLVVGGWGLVGELEVRLVTDGVNHPATAPFTPRGDSIYN